MKLVSFRTIVAGVTASAALFASSAHAARSTLADRLAVPAYESGQFSVSADGVVTGTYPPGYTVANPPSDPSDPTLRQRLLSARDTSKVVIAGSGEAKAARLVQCGNAVSPCGCVFLSVNVDQGAGLLKHKGWMSGCASGGLKLHVYVNDANTHRRIIDHPTLGCTGTSCVGPSHSSYLAGIRNCTGRYDVYSHGWNTRTNGDNIAWITVRPSPYC